MFRPSSTGLNQVYNKYCYTLTIQIFAMYTFIYITTMYHVFADRRPEMADVERPNGVRHHITIFKPVKSNTVCPSHYALCYSTDSVIVSNCSIMLGHLERKTEEHVVMRKWKWVDTQRKTKTHCADPK